MIRTMQRATMRVLYLTPSMAPGGAEQWLSTLVRHGVHSRAVGILCGSDSGEYLTDQVNGVPITYVSQSPKETREQAMCRYIADYRRPFDLIVYWGLGPMDLGFTGVPVIHVSHRSGIERVDGWSPSLPSLANYHVGVSRSAIQDFPKEVRDDAFLIHNGVDVERAMPVHGREWQRKQWEIKEDETLLLFVGRFFEGKGAKKALAMLEHLDETYKLCLYGWGKEASTLMDLADKYPGRVIIPKHPRMKALGDLYAAADCLVMPSESEAFPLVMIEAFHAELPVVCKRWDVIDELESFYGDRLVTSLSTTDPQAFAQAVQDVVPPAAAYLLARNQFTASAMVGRYETYFKEVLGDWHSVGL